MIQMCEMLPKIWSSTKQKDKVSARFIAQLRKRLPAVQNIHPDFDIEHAATGKLQRPALKEMLIQAAKIDEHYPAPFSVYIHGDFNLDNILFDSQEQKLRFIDLHRSEHMDYVQDVSVFIVSGLRLPLFDQQSRQMIAAMATQLYDCAFAFAQHHKDRHFTKRMALGLARSLITSTRFILDKSHANSLYERGVYLLEHLLEHQDSKDYPLPLKEILHV